VINDMGYTNAQGTHAQLSGAAASDVSFVWHGGDLSYADDWYALSLHICDQTH
jgi:acid phosphatase